METKIVTIDENEYFCVKVTIIYGRNSRQATEIKEQAQLARETATANGYDPKTQQRMTDHGKNYYAFRKQGTVVH